MKKLIYLILFIAIVNVYGECDWPLVDRGFGFGIQNNTQDTITWYIPKTDLQVANAQLPQERPTLINYILPGEAHGEFLQALEGKNYYDELPTDTLYIFILDYNKYMNLSWDSIRANTIFYERLEFTEADMKRMDYIIEID